MKNKIAIASAFLAAASFSTAEIVINDFLSFEGFVDMSYSHFDGELDSTGLDADETDNSFGIDQVEISWLFDFDPVTAQIDIEYEGSQRSVSVAGNNNPNLTSSGDNDAVVVEQAFVTYHFDNGGAITAGRYASMLGFEAFEPTGLYQFSTAYTLPNALGDLAPGVSGVSFDPLPLYNQGVKYTQESDNTFFGISIQDGIYSYGNRLGGDSNGDGTSVDGGGYGVEIAGAYSMDNGLSFFLGGAYETGDGSGVIDDTEALVLNAYATFETGAWIFAAEVVYGDSESDLAAGGNASDIENLNFLVMANFAYSDQASVTGRVSYIDYEDDTTGGAPIDDVEQFKYTLAHNYAFTDNLLLVTEVNYKDGDFDGNANDGDFEEIEVAVELLFTF